MAPAWGPPVIAQVLSWLAALGITGTVAAATAYGIFRLLAKSWLKNQFDKDLEAFKASKSQELEKLKNEYAQETERLRGEINRLMDRATKFHQREYDVLPTAWGLLCRADGAASAVLKFYQEFENLDTMSPTRLKEFFVSLEMKPSDIEEITAASNKTEVYSKIRTWKMISNANSAAMAYQNYLVLNGLFIAPKLEEKLRRASTLLHGMILNRRFVEEGTERAESMKQAQEQLRQLEPLIVEIKADMQTRVWDVSLPSPTALLS